MSRIPVAFDMETSDPDDVACLCFLCYHPKISLRAVTITPGSLEQIGLVRYFLKRCEKDINVGARKPDNGKPGNVSGFFRKHFPVDPMAPTGFGWQILEEFYRENPDGVLLTGASLGNPRELLEKTKVEIPRWVGQGGFAGDSVVPEEYRLDKFKGMETCPTFNFNGDRNGALQMLNDPRVKSRQLVSKNVCHGMVYDKQMHSEVIISTSDLVRDVFHELMTKYLEDHPQGKLFHDPLAAATIISDDVCQFEPVEVYYQKGQWGSRKKEGTGTKISIKADRKKFIETLQGGPWNDSTSTAATAVSSPDLHAPDGTGPA